MRRFAIEFCPLLRARSLSTFVLVFAFLLTFRIRFLFVPDVLFRLGIHVFSRYGLPAVSGGIADHFTTFFFLLRGFLFPGALRFFF